MTIKLGGNGSSSEGIRSRKRHKKFEQIDMDTSTKDKDLNNYKLMNMKYMINSRRQMENLDKNATQILSYLSGLM